MTATDKDVAEVLDAKLAGVSGLPVVFWENGKPDSGSEDEVPRLETSLFVQDPETYSLAGRHRRRYIYQVTVVVAEHEYQWSARDYAEAITAAFAWNTDIAGLSNGRLFVYRRPNTSTGQPENAEWRLPVSIYLELIE